MLRQRAKIELGAYPIGWKRNYSLKKDYRATAVYNILPPPSYWLARELRIIFQVSLPLSLLGCFKVGSITSLGGRIEASSEKCALWVHWRTGLVAEIVASLLKSDGYKLEATTITMAGFTEELGKVAQAQKPRLILTR